MEGPPKIYCQPRVLRIAAVLRDGYSDCFWRHLWDAVLAAEVSTGTQGNAQNVSIIRIWNTHGSSPNMGVKCPWDETWWSFSLKAALVLSCCSCSGSMLLRHPNNCNLGYSWGIALKARLIPHPFNLGLWLGDRSKVASLLNVWI